MIFRSHICSNEFPSIQKVHEFSLFVNLHLVTLKAFRGDFRQRPQKRRNLDVYQFVQDPTILFVDKTIFSLFKRTGTFQFIHIESK